MASPITTSPTDLPYGTVVIIKLKQESNVSDFVADFSPLLNYVAAKEPRTLIYELHRKEDDPLTLVIYEKYQTENDLKVTHNSSEAFKEFVGKIRTVTYVEKLELIVTRAVDDARVLVSAEHSVEAAAGDGILVFCGARAGKNAANMEAGANLGKAIAAKGRTLVYGGGTVGIMGAVVTAAVANNGKVKSVIPRSMIPREVSGEMLGDVTYTHTMSHRKSVMFRHSNTVIALPGGLGTFDELLETITLLQLNAYRPKIGFLNVGGFFDAFFTFLRHLISEGYVEENIFDFFVVENSGDGNALLEKLDAFSVPPSITTLQWSSPTPY